MFVVSGCPRSGTSLMMDLCRVAFGEDRILGKKFPQEEQIEMVKEQHEMESDNSYAARMYIFNKTRDEEKIMKDLEESKDMNPNGFWEMLYTCQGVHYRFGDLPRLEKLQEEKDGEKSICKIVSQGLAQSDPKYIDKIVYMIRHPRSVAKSQERLKRQFPFSNSEEDKMLVNGEEQAIHTPEMYIQVTAMAARWLIKYPDVPVIFVNFDELIEKPNETLQGIRDFLNDGDFESAAKQIEPRLRRSQPQDVENDLWEDAENIYKMFCEKDFEGIVEYMKNPNLMIYRKNKRWLCTRLNEPKTENECLACQKSSVVRNNFKQRAEKKEINWQDEPCIFECAHNPDEPLKTIGESVEFNTWANDDSLIHLPADIMSNFKGPQSTVAYAPMDDDTEYQNIGNNMNNHEIIEFPQCEHTAPTKSSGISDNEQ
jgi:hypothetical protein